MKIQVLVATMFQENYSLLEKMNIQSDAIIVNQCHKNERHIIQYGEHTVLWIDSTERGLSKSRNLALDNAQADICVICDDDETLSVGYPLMIKNAYADVSGADVIVFNINRVGWDEQEQIFVKPRKIGCFKTYSSVHITFRRKRIMEKKILFDTRFGTGSEMYLCAEDAIFCMDCHKSKLQMYTYPGVLCTVDCGKSTWFDGYNERYFYDVGAYLATSFPRLKSVLKWYYPLRCAKLSHMNSFAIISAINKGVKGYKRQLSFDQYQASRK